MWSEGRWRDPEQLACVTVRVVVRAIVLQVGTVVRIDPFVFIEGVVFVFIVEQGSGGMGRGGHAAQGATCLRKRQGGREKRASRKRPARSGSGHGAAVTGRAVGGRAGTLRVPLVFRTVRLSDTPDHLHARHLYSGPRRSRLPLVIDTGTPHNAKSPTVSGRAFVRGCSGPSSATRGTSSRDFHKPTP